MSTTRFSDFDNFLDGVQVIDRELKYLYLNAVVAYQGKSTVDQLLGRRMEECYPGIEKTDLFQKISACIKQNQNFRFINDYNLDNGEKRWFDLSIQPVKEGALILSHDITPMIDLEKELTVKNVELNKRIDQVEVLVQELHHRVRNNLQIIISLINLYSNKIEDDKALLALGECKHYIESLASVYNSLQSEDDFTMVNFNELIRKLVENYSDKYPNEIRILNPKVDEAEVVQIDFALTFGLLLSEITKNLIQHRRLSDHTTSLEVDYSLNRHRSEFWFSLKTKLDLEGDSLLEEQLDDEIIQLLSEQLDGEISLVDKQLIFTSPL